MKNFRCNIVDLPYRGVLAGFIEESAESSESTCKKSRSFCHAPGRWKFVKIVENYQTYNTHAARTHASAAAGMHTAVAGMHTIELSNRKLAQKFMHRARGVPARV
jgi:hypothetical protein